jgi:aminoglycoside 6'-N-acetyltransferase
VAHPAVALRPAGRPDLPALQELARSDAVRPFVSWAAEDLLAASLDADGEHVLVIEADGAFAGGARLSVFNARSRIWTVGPVMLDPAVRGRGLGAAALRAVARFAFDAGAHRVQAEILAHNTAGLRAFDAAGFTREGVRRQAWRRDGWQDGVHVGLLAGELVD